jgi:hypothetical protein
MKFEDYLGIHNVLGRYAHVMDNGSRGLRPWQDLGLIFTPDAVFDFTAAGGGVADGLDAIIEVMSGGKHPSGHHFTNPVIEMVDADHVTSLTKLVSIEKNGQANTGHYFDHIVRTEDGWRISNRTAVVYFTVPKGG